MSARELIVGGLRGFRWWRLDPEGWFVSPWRGEHRWLPDTNRAACLYRKRFGRWRPARSPHPEASPAASCDCGFYALNQVPAFRRPPVRFGWEIGVTTSGDPEHGLVFGVAAAHGRVLIGTDGWRAEIARPLALLWSREAELDERFERMQQRYAIPTYRSLPALVAEWGPDEIERDLSTAA